MSLAKCLLPIIENKLKRGLIVGTSVMVMQHGELLCELHEGFADREEQKPVTANTIFRLASLTKPIVTSVALLLAEQGIIDLEQPVAKWLPYFQPALENGTTPHISLYQLCLHTSGLSYGFLYPDNHPYHAANISDGLNDAGLSMQENLTRLAKMPLLFAPGTSWCYSLATDVLGAVLEAATGATLAQLVATYITEPLKMPDTTFYIARGSRQQQRLATAYADAHIPRGRARRMQEQDRVRLDPTTGFIHFAPSRIHNPHAYNSGGGGMAGTAWDYIKFLEMVRTARQNQVGRLSPYLAHLMTSDLVPNFEVLAAGPGCGFGLGFATIRQPDLVPTPRAIGSFGWGGVYGNNAFVDPVHGLTVVLLTNTAVYGLMGSYAAEITKAIYTHLGLN